MIIAKSDTLFCNVAVVLNQIKILFQISGLILYWLFFSAASEDFFDDSLEVSRVGESSTGKNHCFGQFRQCMHWMNAECR